MLGLQQALIPLRSRNFRYFWLGQTASALGSVAGDIAWVWLIIAIGGSTSSIGVVYAAGAIPPILLMSLGGVWVDRGDARKLGGFAEAASAIAGCALAAFAVMGHVSVPSLVGFAVVFGIFQAIANPAFGALFPDTVSPAVLPAANALRQFAAQVALLVGPGIGGLLIAQWSIPVALAFNALTFAVSALCIFRMGHPPTHNDTYGRGGEHEPDASGHPEARAPDSLAGARYLLSHRTVLAYVVLFAITNALNNVQMVLVPILVTGELRMNAGQFGLIASLSAVGALGGSLLVGVSGGLGPRRALVVCASSALSGAAIVWMGAANGAGVLFAASALFGASFVVSEIVMSSVWQQVVPAELRGRVFGLLSTISMSLNPVGLLLAGVIGEAVGPRVGLWAGGGAIVVLSLGALIFPVVRRLDNLVPTHYASPAPSS